MSHNAKKSGSATPLNAAHWLAVDAVIAVFEQESPCCVLEAEPGFGADAVMDAACAALKADAKEEEGDSFAVDPIGLRVRPDAFDVASISNSLADALHAPRPASAEGLRSAGAKRLMRGRQAVVLEFSPGAVLSAEAATLLDALTEQSGGGASRPLPLIISADRFVSEALIASCRGPLSETERHLKLRPHSPDEVRSLLRCSNDVAAAAYEATSGSPEVVAELLAALKKASKKTVALEVVNRAIEMLASKGGESFQGKVAAARGAAHRFECAPLSHDEVGEDDAPGETPAVASNIDDPRNALQRAPSFDPAAVRNVGARAQLKTPGDPMRARQKRRQRAEWRRTLAGAAVAACAGAVGLIALSGVRGTPSPPPAFVSGDMSQTGAEVMTTGWDGPQTPEAKLLARLRDAKEHFAAGRFTVPRGASAYDALLAAFKLSPNDERVSDALQMLADHYENEARRALERSDFDEFYRINDIIDRIGERKPI